MGGRGSTFKERSKNLNTLIEYLKQNKNKNSSYFLDIGEISDEREIVSNEKINLDLNNKNYILCSSINNLDSEIKKIYLNQVNSLSEKYSNIIKTNEIPVHLRTYKMNNVNLKTLSKSPNFTTNACFATKKDEIQICLNKRIYTSLQDVKDGEKQSQSTGHHVKVKSEHLDKYSIVHEFGHYIEDCIIQKRLNNSNATLKEREDVAIDLFKEVMEGIDLNNTSQYRLSRYQYKNAFEWFAETFTSCQLGEKNTLLTNNMNKLLKKENLNG